MIYLKLITMISTLSTWAQLMANLRINPKAVCRNLITRLDGYKPLSAKDEAAIIRAIESSGVPNATDRMLASLSRNTLNELLNRI